MNFECCDCSDNNYHHVDHIIIIDGERLKLCQRCTFILFSSYDKISIAIKLKKNWSIEKVERNKLLKEWNS